MKTVAINCCGFFVVIFSSYQLHASITTSEPDCNMALILLRQNNLKRNRKQNFP